MESKVLETIRDSTLIHHKHIDTYPQIEMTINYSIEIPVFQFICDIFPTSMKLTTVKSRKREASQQISRVRKPISAKYLTFINENNSYLERIRLLGLSQ